MRGEVHGQREKKREKIFWPNENRLTRADQFWLVYRPANSGWFALRCQQNHAQQLWLGLADAHLALLSSLVAVWSVVEKSADLEHQSQF